MEIVLIAVAIRLTLQVFWQTRMHGHLQQAHLLRIVVLASVGLLACKTIMMQSSFWMELVCGELAPRQGEWLARCIRSEWYSRSSESISLAILAWSLCLGLSRHLRIEHGVRLGLLVLATVFTAMFLVVVFVSWAQTRGLLGAWPHLEGSWLETMKLFRVIALWIVGG
jgi:hypothetical protein